MNFLENNNLQLLCIKSISFNFERFFILINSNVTESLFSIKVLQKCYCDQLLRMLSESGALKDEHLKFIINKYTREIDLNYLQNCNFCAIDERLEAVGDVITKFSMKTSMFFPSCDGFLHHFQSIQVLELPNSNSTDSTVLIIADVCFQLKSLDVSGCKDISDVGLSYLAKKNPPLQSLNVEYTSVTYKSVALILRNIPTLEKLKFYSVSVGSAIIEAVGSEAFSRGTSDRRFNLSNLVLSGRHLTTVLEGCVKVCPFVKELVVSRIFTPKQLELCSHFQSVNSVHLQLSENVNPKLSIDDFLKMRGQNLTTLFLTYFSVSLEILSHFCPNLENLTLRHPRFEKMTQSDIHFMSLKTLSLYNFELGKQVASILSSSPQLEELHVISCTLSKEVQETVLSSCKQLRILHFFLSPVTPDFILQVFETCTDLSSLTLRNAGLSKEDFKYIRAVVKKRRSKVRVIWEISTDEGIVHRRINLYKKGCCLRRAPQTT